MCPLPFSPLVFLALSPFPSPRPSLVGSVLKASFCPGFHLPSLQSSTDPAPFTKGFFTPQAPSFQFVTLLTTGAEIKPQKVPHQLSCSRSSASFSHWNVHSPLCRANSTWTCISQGKLCTASHCHELHKGSTLFPLQCSESLSSVSSSQSRIFKSFPAPGAHPATSPSGCTDPGAQHPQRMGLGFGTPLLIGLLSTWLLNLAGNEGETLG